MQKIIWVLKDDRAGNYSQGIGLAEALSQISGAKIQIKEIKYNFLAKLPNFLKINGLWGIGLSSENSLLNQNEKPDIVISAGRKTAPIAAFLKKKYRAVALQIMNPNFDFRKFDSVILPNHDKKNKNPNVIRILGSLTRINDSLLEEEYQKFTDILGNITSPKVALLVGGSSKEGNFSVKIAQDLGGSISSILRNMNANLLVLNSRRTGDEITTILDDSLVVQKRASKYFFKWKKDNWQNPYFAVLQAADFIVVTGDSISMCSEICSLGKPVYIFNPPEICSTKHLQFHQDLFDGGFACKLDKTTMMLGKFDAKKLNETTRVAKKIISYSQIN